jgi:hypothetical protein
MVFGRKKRPSQPEGEPTPTDLADLGTAGEDDDIIELVDILEISDNQRTGTDLLGLSEAAFDDEFAEGPSTFDMTPQEVAGILEDDAAEVLEDEDVSQAEPLFADQGRQATGLTREESETVVELDAFGGEESVLIQDFDVDRLLEEDDTDTLIAELMASNRHEEVEEGGVLVEEYVVEDQESPVFQRDEDLFKGGDDQEGMIDFGVPESEPSELGADEEMARLFDTTLAEEMAAEADAAAAAEQMPAPVPVVEAVATAVEDHFVEEEALVPAPQEERDVASVEAEVQALFAPVSEPVEVAAACAADTAAPLLGEAPIALVDQVEPPFADGSLPSTVEIIAPATEPLFSITSSCPVPGNLMMIEEEILFAYRPGEEVPESGGQIGTPGGEPEILPEAAEGHVLCEEIEGEAAFSLDTFLPVLEGEAIACAEELELLDLVERMEAKLLSNLQGGVDARLPEIVCGAVKEELEGLRRLIDQIESIEELRL